MPRVYWQALQCGAASGSFPQRPHARWVHEHVEAEAAAQEAAAAAQEAANPCTWRLWVPVRENVQEGPLGTWGRNEVLQLRRAMQNWDSYDADRRKSVEDLLWSKFNSIMRPVGALAHLWANVRWRELNLTYYEFEAESQCQRFVVTFDTCMFSYDEFTVGIIYSGPVRFRRRPGMLNAAALEMLNPVAPEML